MSARQPYPSDLTALQWDNIEHLFPRPKGPAGRKRVYDRKDVVDAVLYMARTGCSGGRCRTTSRRGRRWRTNSTPGGTPALWERSHDTLRRDVRRADGLEETPSAGVLDSQSVKTTEAGGPKGYDGGKRWPAASGACLWTRWA